VNYLPYSMTKGPAPTQVLQMYIPVFLIFCIMCTCFSGGCIHHENTETNATIRIGILLPLSGEFSARGYECLNGSLLAIDEINKNGGIQSKGGRLLEYYIADSKGNATIGAQKTKELIHDAQVRVIIGAYQSTVAIAATQVAEQYKTPFIVNTGVSDIIIERGFAYTFRIIPSVDDYAYTKVQFLKALNRIFQTPIQRVALIYENSAFGTGAALSEHTFLKKEGFTIISETSYVPSNVSSFLHTIRMVADEKPDAIFTTTYLKDGVFIVQELRDAGYTGPVIDSGGGTISQSFIDSLHDKAEGMYSISELVYSLPAVRELNSRYYNRFGVNLSGASAYTYQAVLVLEDALNRSVTLERKDIRNALSTTNITTYSENLLPDDMIAFGPNGQNDFSRLTIMQVRNGTWKTVWPEHYADSDVTGLFTRRS